MTVLFNIVLALLGHTLGITVEIYAAMKARTDIFAKKKLQIKQIYKLLLYFSFVIESLNYVIIRQIYISLFGEV